MFKKFPFIVIWFIVAGLSVCYFFNLYEFFSKSYYVDESKLYKIDTFHLYNKAYKVSDNQSGKFSHSYPKLVFQSTNGYSFAIDKYIYEAVADKKKLEDTLMNDDLKFTVYTNKENFEDFKKYSYPIFIRVYQIQIGDMRYIDIQKINAITKGNIKRGVLLPPAFIFFFGFLLYKENKSSNWWTKPRIALWLISFIITITGLLLLT